MEVLSWLTSIDLLTGRRHIAKEGKSVRAHRCELNSRPSNITEIMKSKMSYAGDTCSPTIEERKKARHLQRKQANAGETEDLLDINGNYSFSGRVY